MNQFDYINHKLENLFADSDKSANFKLQIFFNQYRYDPALHKIKPHWKTPGRYNITMHALGQYKSKDTKCNTCGYLQKERKCKKSCRHNNIIQHSWEPLCLITDKEFWDIKKQSLEDSYNITQKEYVLHSERSPVIGELTSMGFNPVHWFANGVLCSQHWYRLYKDINVVTEYRPLTHNYICATRLIDKERNYRVKFLNLLNTDTGLYSLLDADPQTGRSPTEIYPENKVAPNSFDEHDNSSAWVNLTEPWKTSFLHVVSETVVDRIHLTEKIFKPIVLHQPFVLLNGRGGLEYMRKYGFLTFSDFWDEEYDNVWDLNTRMQMVAKIVNDIGGCSLKELEQMRKHMMPILDRNYAWFYNEFPEICWRELVNKVYQKR